MNYILGFIIAFSTIFFGFILTGGSAFILLQPVEIMMIGGTGLGIFILSNPPVVIGQIFREIPKVVRKQPYSQRDYLALLIFLYEFYRYVRTNGILAMEAHIERPRQSAIFKRHPNILKNKSNLTFFCDYMRLLSLGFNKPYEMEEMMEQEIEVRRQQTRDMLSALYRLGDALPALGIIVAVLGMITAMGGIDQPAEIIGRRIGSALLGTFFGILMSYCIVSPIGHFLEKYNKEELIILECIKASIASFARSNPPIICIEFARQMVPDHLKPSFDDLESTISKALHVPRNSLGQPDRD
jgi:chemotaxis protein MotA